MGVPLPQPHHTVPRAGHGRGVMPFIHRVPLVRLWQVGYPYLTATQPDRRSYPCPVRSYPASLEKEQIMWGVTSLYLLGLKLQNGRNITQACRLECVDAYCHLRIKASAAGQVVHCKVCVLYSLFLTEDLLITILARTKICTDSKMHKVLGFGILGEHPSIYLPGSRSATSFQGEYLLIVYTDRRYFAL